MRLGYIIVYVPDVPAALDFYERAFGLERRFLHIAGQPFCIPSKRRFLPICRRYTSLFSLPRNLGAPARATERSARRRGFRNPESRY